jgi:hypothetical protein
MTASAHKRHSQNGAYWQAFGPKKQTRACALPISLCPAGTMFEGGDFRIVPRCEARSERPLSGAPPPPVPSSAAIWRERAALRLCGANSISA